MLPLYTPEERKALLVIAKEAKLEKAKQREENKHLLKLSYLDSNYWATLASKYQIRMPNQEEACSISSINKYIKRCDIPRETFNEAYTSAAYFVKHNKTFTSYAVAGLILELKEERLLGLKQQLDV